MLVPDTRTRSSPFLHSASVDGHAQFLGLCIITVVRDEAIISFFPKVAGYRNIFGVKLASNFSGKMQNLGTRV